MIPNAQTADAGHPEAMAQLVLAILQDAAKAKGRDRLRLIRMAVDGGDEPAAFATAIFRLLRKAPARGRKARRAPANVSRETRKSMTSWHGKYARPHGEHRRIGLAALAYLDLDEVWWLVSPQNPLKPKRPAQCARTSTCRHKARSPPRRTR
jgi:hypothetical protein